VRYGSVTALDGVSLSAFPGEVLCLVGDNGAGKSTIAKVLSGAVRPDQGRISLAGKEVRFGSPSAARTAGIETVYQDLALCPNLGAAHNLVLGAEPSRRILGLPVRDDRKAEQEAAERLTGLGIRLPDHHAPVRALSGGQRQAVAIARAVKGHVRVLILDEPTAALGATQQVFAIADRVAVLRLGRLAFEGSLEATDELALLQLIAGVDRGASTQPSTP
jgi:ABC-type sugar transport system ATPase subunit